jgi:WD40 repeat protein
VSVAADGRVLFWTLRNRLQQPEHGAVLTAGDASGARRGGAARGRVLGGTALSFSLDCATYVVGTEGGALLKCVRGDGAAAAARRRGGGLGGGEPTVREGDFEWSLEAHALLQGAEAAHQPELRRQVEKHARLQGAKVVQLAHVFGARPDPVKLFPSSAKLAFAPHRGPVYGLQFSPFHRGVFLAASTDGTLSLFSLLAQAPALVIDLARPLLDVAWSPARPLVFAASDWAGSVHVFDLSASTSTPALTLQHPRRAAAQAAAASDALAVNAVAFASGGALLASCDEAGCACLWRLSPRLVEQQPGEVAELARLASASHADDAAVPA